ncbi:MAG: VCBS repeat-containing protein [Acidobacteria bacterium]|nr:VCBS repeat-containing protein [Acidobacteriota bacterium]MBI3656004.1 VCBS repeat-containing protein [Acidobacteriota bacterium]
MKGNYIRTERPLAALLLVVWFFLQGSHFSIDPITPVSDQVGSANLESDTLPKTPERLPTRIDSNAAIENLLERKKINPVEFFTHWADNSFHSIFADFNNDGLLDAAFSGRLSGHDHKIEVWAGNGVGWNDPVLLEEFYAGSHLSFYDINNDGYADLVTTEPVSHLMVAAFLGSGDGSFTLCRDLAAMMFSSATAQWVSSRCLSVVSALPERFRFCRLTASAIGLCLKPVALGLSFSNLHHIQNRLLDLRLWGRSPPSL